ncbi:hypothetical protein N7470_002176 [Penicillium chermesinum]|nr:hypothetical protein N7470_002176 [Penicillium chermesinum]
MHVRVGREADGNGRIQITFVDSSSSEPFLRKLVSVFEFGPLCPPVILQVFPGYGLSIRVSLPTINGKADVAI